MHKEHRDQQSGIHWCGRTTRAYPQLSVDRPQSAASLGAASCATRGLELARSLAKANSGDGDNEATSGPRAFVWRHGLSPVRTLRRRRGGRARSKLSLVSRSAMGRELGQHLRLGLESMPRLGTLSRSRWSDGQRTLGASAVVGAAATIATTVGAGRERDVEYDGSCLGILEQQDLDPALTPASLRRPRFHYPDDKAISAEDRHRSKTGQGQTNSTASQFRSGPSPRR